MTWSPQQRVVNVGAVFVLALAISPTAFLSPPVIGASPDGERKPSVEEARGRAELLHETVHATLQIVHRQYYREDEQIPIPAATLRTVFRELAERRGVELRWLAVDAQAMNVNHLAQDAFEKAAVKSLAGGETSFEQTENGVYRRAGVIRLSSECLKCHLPTRTSNKSRSAALVVQMPVADR